MWNCGGRTERHGEVYVLSRPGKWPETAEDDEEVSEVVFICIKRLNNYHMYR